ncbi:MAG: hypothetical protein IH991_11470 [Planctomycetes bacterium]|nr:hypothetical protein [Planctomycetota bacterium]
MTDHAKSSSEPQPAEECESSSGSNESHGPSARIRVVVVLFVVAVTIGGAVAMVTNRPSGPADRGIDEKVTTVGSVEVTGRLIEIRGKFLPNDGLYNYAFVMKYEILKVHRGEVDAKEIVVAHYNPLKPRPQVADEFYPDIGGTLTKFRAGDVHRMALEVPIDDHYIGGIVDRYFEQKEGPIYWAVWTNLANRQ